MKTLTICFYFYKEYFFFFLHYVFLSHFQLSVKPLHFTLHFTLHTLQKKTKNKKHPEFNFQIVPFHLSLAPKLLFQHAMLFLYFSN